MIWSSWCFGPACGRKRLQLMMPVMQSASKPSADIFFSDLIARLLSVLDFADLADWTAPVQANAGGQYAPAPALSGRQASGRDLPRVFFAANVSAAPLY